MRYDSYYSKMQRFARFMRKIFRHIVPISIVLGIIIVATVATVISVGSFKGEFAYPDILTYGDAPENTTKAFLSDVYYEYKPKGGNEWTTTIPDTPGEYVVRAVSSKAFGGKKYSPEKAFVLNKKSIEVKVADTTVRYGDALAVSADLAPGDKITCGGFRYATMSEGVITVTPEAEKIVILNKDGKDVTSSYNVAVASTNVTLEKRPLTVTVSDQKKYYDGVELAFDGFEYNEDQLAEGDILIASFDKSIVDAGEIINEPTIQIKNAQGKDVTSYYQINSVWGNLTVHKYILNVSINGFEFVYDGKSHSFDTEGEAYSISEEDKAFMEGLGHSLRVVKNVTVTDVKDGEDLQNALEFKVYDNNGVDVTDNYNLFFAMGNAKITVNKRPLKIDLNDVEKIYDGTPADRIYTVTEVNGLLEDKINASVIVFGGGKDDVSFPLAETGHTLTFVLDGNRTNVRLTDEEKDTYSVSEIVISDANGNDVTDNYDIQSDTATLSVTPRSIAVQTFDATKIYDGKPIDRLYRVVEDYDSEATLGDAGKIYATSDNISVDLACTGQKLYFTLNGNKTNADDNMLSGESGTYSPTNIRITCGEGEEEQEISLDNYTIVTNSASLSISRKEITVTAGSAEKTYDGKKLSCTSFTNDPLAEGHTIDVTIVDGFTDHTGDAEGNNLITSIVIKDANENVVTDNYNITAKAGTIKITQRSLSIELFSNEKIYDGVAIDRKYQITEKDDQGNSVVGEVVTVAGNTGDDVSLNLSQVENHSIRFTLSGNRTNVALDDYNSAEYTASDIKIFNENGQEVSGNFAVTVKSASINVKPRELKLIAPSASKVFDGTSLTRDFSSAELARIENALNSKDAVFYFDDANTGNAENLHNLTVTDLADGIRHTIEITVVGEELNMTETPIGNDTQYKHGNNVIGEVVIKENGKDVTSNYSIEKISGDLNVTRNQIVLVLENMIKYYDGASFDYNTVLWEKHKIEGQEVKGSGLADNHRIVDVKIGYKDENGNEITSFTEVGSVTTYIKSFRIVDEEGNDVTDDYNIGGDQKRDGNLVILPYTFDVEMKSESKVYDGKALNRQFRVKYLSMKTDYDGNTLYTDYIYNGETYKMPQYEENYTDYITVSDNGRASFEVNGRVFDIKFEGENITDAKRSEWKVDVITTSGAALPECYAYNQTFVGKPDGTSATLEIFKRKLEIVVFDESKIYDGKILKGKNFTVSEEDNSGVMNAHSGTYTVNASDYYDIDVASTGEKLRITLSGNITDAVSGKSNANATVENGRNIENYGISYTSGNLKITARPIVIRMYGAEKIYDGKALGRYFEIDVLGDNNAILKTESGYVESDNVMDIIMPEVLSSQILSVAFTGKDALNASTSNFGVDEDAYKINGGDIDADNYSFTYEYYDADGTKITGATQTTLKIDKREVIIEVQDITKVYDGKILKGKNFTVNEKIAENTWNMHATTYNVNSDDYCIIEVISTGEKLRIDLTGTIKDAGFTLSKASTTLECGNSIDNYFIENRDGGLTIEKRPIVIKMYGINKIYDAEYSYRRYEINIFDGNGNSIASETGVVDKNNIGNNTVEFRLNDVSDQTLEIEFSGKNVIDVIKDSAWDWSNIKVYDTEYSDINVNNNFDISYEYYSANGTKADAATINISPRNLSITVLDNEKTYDGVALRAEYINVFQTGADGKKATVSPDYSVIFNNNTMFVESEPINLLVTGHKMKVNLKGEQTNATASGSTGRAWVYSVEITDANGNSIDPKNYGIDTTDYSKISQDGKLTVNKRVFKITVPDRTKIYDGKDLVGNVIFETQSGDRGIVSTHVFEVIDYAPITIKNAGSINNKLGNNHIRIVTGSGEVVTQNYEIDTKSEFGTLKVEKRKIRIEIEDVEKVYDAKPLYATKFALTEFGKNSKDELVEVYSNNYSISVNPSNYLLRDGSIKIETTEEQMMLYFIGEKINVLGNEDVVSDVDLNKSTVGGISVNKNYDIEVVKGSITITPKSASITTGSKTFTYNGMQNSCEEYTQAGFVSGHTVVVNKFKTVKDVTVNPVKNDIADEDFSIVYYDGTQNVNINKSNYDITMNCGELVVNPLTLTFDTAGKNDTQVYGKKASNKSFRVQWIENGSTAIIKYDSLAIGEDVFRIVTSEITHVNETAIGNNRIEKIYVNGVLICYYDNSGNFVNESSNYKILFGSFGNLTINPLEISVVTHSATKVYDGKALTQKSVTVATINALSNVSIMGVNGKVEIVEGDVIEVVLSGTQTNVGVSKNSLDYIKVGDSIIYNGYNVGYGDYKVVSVEEGDLEVTKREVLITPESLEKYYDGKNFSEMMQADKYVASNLVDGHVIEKLDILITSDEVNVGMRNTDCELKDFVIKNGNVDVSGNYTVIMEDPSLIISARPIKVTTVSADKIYDGMPLYIDLDNYGAYDDKPYSVEKKNGDRGLVDGHTVVITFTGSITDPGIIDNTAVIMIEEHGVNVTGNYDVEYVYGLLEVRKIKINIIETGSAEKFDDGTPLVCEKANEMENMLLDGHRISVTFTGIQTRVGTSENTVDKNTLKIVDENGNDVSRLYDINDIVWIYGTLTINLRNNTSINPGINIPQSGSNSPIGLPEWVDSLEDLDQGALYNILAVDSAATRLYFKQMSFGAYNGNSWGSAIESDYMITIGGEQYSMAYLTGFILSQKNYQSNMVKITPLLMNNYITPYYLAHGMGSIQTSDTTVSGNGKSAYSLMYYSGVDWNALASSQYANYEGNYVTFVKSQYLDIEESTSSYLITYMRNHGIIDGNTDIQLLTDAQKLELVVKVSEYMQTTDNLKYNLGYNRALDSSNDVAVAFLRGDYGSEGVCQHYATAATLMFRALGIPARYTVGYIADVTGVSYDITGKDAHAWVEVYIDGLGWRYVEVTGGFPNGGNSVGGAGVTGTPDGNKEILKIGPNSISKPYDGTSLNANSFTWYSVGNTGFDQTDKYDVIVTFGGSITECGIGTSTIEDIKIIDKSTMEVVYYHSEGIGTDKYFFKFVEGSLLVKKVLYVEVGQCPYTYNGEAQNYDADRFLWIYGHSDVTSSAAECLGRDEESGDFFLMDNLRHQGVIRVHIEMQFGLTDVGSVSLTELNSMEGVVKRLTVTHYDDYAEDGNRIYGIGEGIDVTDEYSYVFCDYNGNTESDTYHPLSIKKCTVKIKVTDVSRIYNDSYTEKPLASNAYTILEDSGFPEGIVLEIETTGSISTVGTVTNTVSDYKFWKIIYDDNGQEKSRYEINKDNFDFTWIGGSLTLTQD